MANLIVGLPAHRVRAGDIHLLDLYRAETGRDAAPPEEPDEPVPPEKEPPCAFTVWLRQRLGDQIDCCWSDEHPIVGVYLGDTREGNTWDIGSVWKAERTVAQTLRRAGLSVDEPICLHAFYPPGLYLFGGYSNVFVGIEATELGYVHPEGESEGMDDEADYEERFRDWLTDRGLPPVPALDYVLGVEDGTPWRDAVGKSVLVADTDSPPVAIPLSDLRRRAADARRELKRIGFRGCLSLVPVNSW